MLVFGRHARQIDPIQDDRQPETPKSLGTTHVRRPATGQNRTVIVETLAVRESPGQMRGALRPAPR